MAATGSSRDSSISTPPENGSHSTGDGRTGSIETPPESLENTSESEVKNNNHDRSVSQTSKPDTPRPKRASEKQLEKKDKADQDVPSNESDPKAPEDTKIQDEKENPKPLEYSEDGLLKMDMESISATFSKGRTETKKLSEQRLRQHIEYGFLTAHRVSRLEEKVDALEKREPSPPPTKEQQRTSAIPELNYVEWSNFKALRNRKDTHYAVDVLRGDPILFHHRQKQTIDVRGTKIETDAGQSSERSSTHSSSLPERIRINSISLIKILKKITGDTFNDDREDRPIVIMRPFKPLFYHLDDLREHLENLERKLKEEDGDKDKNKGKGKDKDEKPRDSTPMPDMEDEPAGDDLPQSPDARDDLKCLIGFLDKCLKHISSFEEAADKNPKIAYHDLWHLFKPGRFVIAKKGPQPLWRVLQATSGRPFLSDPVAFGPWVTPEGRSKDNTWNDFTIDCYYVDFNGKEWGRSQRQFRIARFEGLKEVTSLEIFPLEYGEESKRIVEWAERRGKIFLESCKSRHMYFKGRSLIDSPLGIPIPKLRHADDIDSHVIVDFDRSLQFNPEWHPDLTEKPTAASPSYEFTEMTTNDAVKCGESKSCHKVFCCMNENILKDFQWDTQRMEDFVKERKEESRRESIGEDELLPKELILLPNRVFGFVLRSRKWACLRVDGLSPPQEDKYGFEQLEIKLENKRVIKGLVQSHYRSRESNVDDDNANGFDLVRAKGKGLIILLHGAPGVGKTSTAECVAALHARPLFPITCGDLGMTPAEVEKNLDFNFQLAESWGCVLLLDEADVFLAERTKGDVKRNALVSVFLRALEYYRGILFLTTNRVGTLDEAFKSRIHVSLLYKPLDWNQTKAIWTNHLNRLLLQGRVVANTESILAYAHELYESQMRTQKIAWNGRQIRNAFQTAVALAEYESIDGSAKPTLQRDQFRTVSDASVEFDDYLKRTLGKTAPQHAHSLELRDDLYRAPVQPVPSYASPVVPLQHQYAPRPNQVPPEFAQSASQAPSGMYPRYTVPTSQHTGGYGFASEGMGVPGTFNVQPHQTAHMQDFGSSAQASSQQQTTQPFPPHQMSQQQAPPNWTTNTTL